MSPKKPNAPSQQPAHPARSPDSTPDGSSVDEVREQIEKSIGPLVHGSSRQQVIERVTSLIVSEQFSGPLPHPRQFQQYEAAYPGSAERIISMAEAVNAAQIEFARTSITQDASDRRLGQKLGFGALLAILTAVIVLAALDKPGMASAVLAIGVAGVITRFIDGRRHRSAAESND